MNSRLYVSSDDIPVMKDCIDHIIKRLIRGQTVAVGEDNEFDQDLEDNYADHD